MGAGQRFYNGILLKISVEKLLGMYFSNPEGEIQRSSISIRTGGFRKSELFENWAAVDRIPNGQEKLGNKW